MANTIALKEHFPLIRDREELLADIKQTPALQEIFDGWNDEQQKEFLDCCTGVKGMKVLYDSFFKEAFNCEYDKSRLEELLSLLLQKKVIIREILPNDSTRLADETSLIITDIVVQLEDGSLANVEIQRIGYAFPGQRCACYSSDMTLRQYKRVRAEKGRKFSYRDIKNVYLIVIFEQSPEEFRRHPDVFLHHGRQHFDSGLEMDMLQEYVLIPLDLFKKSMHNKSIETQLEAWLTFLGDDRPERVIELITAFPRFKAIYNDLYNLCLNTERVISMFSEELRILDRNTVQYMIDEQQARLEEQQVRLGEQRAQINEQRAQIDEQQTQLGEQRAQIDEQQVQIDEQRAQIDGQQVQIDEQRAQLKAKDRELDAQKREIEEQKKENEARRQELELLTQRIQALENKALRGEVL